MKNTLMQEDQSGYANPSPEQLETGDESGKDFSYGDAFQGIEFLSDAIRMEDQALDMREQLKSEIDARRAEIA